MKKVSLFGHQPVLVNNNVVIATLLKARVYQLT